MRRRDDLQDGHVPGLSLQPELAAVVGIIVVVVARPKPRHQDA